MRAISSEAFIRALTRAGFVVYRQAPPVTILERGARAVVVVEQAHLRAEVLSNLRKMASLTWREVDALLAEASGS